MKFLTPHDVVTLLSSQRVQLIDVRDLDVFAGFIPGSRHVPSVVFEEQALQLATEYAEKAKCLVFYCLGSEAMRAKCCARVFESVLQDRIPDHVCDVCVLQGGFDLWKRHVASIGGEEVYISKDFLASGAGADLLNCRSVKRDPALYASATCPELPDMQWMPSCRAGPPAPTCSGTSTMATPTPHELRAATEALKQEFQEYATGASREYATGATEKEYATSACSTAMPRTIQRTDSAPAIGSGTGTEWSRGLTGSVPMEEWQRGPPSWAGSDARSTTQALAAARAAAPETAAAPSKSEGPESEPWRMRLSIGSKVSVWSNGSKRWLDGVVTCVSKDMVMLQYFREDRRCCLKQLPLSSPEFQRKEPTSGDSEEQEAPSDRMTPASSSSLSEVTRRMSWSCPAEMGRRDNHAATIHESR